MDHQLKPIKVKSWHQTVGFDAGVNMSGVRWPQASSILSTVMNFAWSKPRLDLINFSNFSYGGPQGSNSIGSVSVRRLRSDCQDHAPGPPSSILIT